MNLKNILGLSPLIFFLLLYLLLAWFSGGFSKVNIALVFFFSVVYAISITKGLSLPDRVREFGRGAGTTKVMFMICIFLSAGLFTGGAYAMGCIKETVDFILTYLPTNLSYLGIFLAGCVISMATGSGIGSIVAVGPIAVGMAETIDVNMPVMCSAVVCGAMFGDNLSFISDVTIIATTTQGCELKDKFKANLWIALPACIVTMAIYAYLGNSLPAYTMSESLEYWKLIPYIAVLILSLFGCDVLILLFSGIVLCFILGLTMGCFDVVTWMEASGKGLDGTGGLISVVLLASGLLNLIKYNGGIDFIVSLCLKHVKTRRGAEACIGILSALLSICTANNTVAVISVADIAKQLSLKFGVEPKRAASIMDTSACVALELIPYSLHNLAIATIAGISAASMIPNMFYAYGLGIMTILVIIFGRGKKVPAEV